jgi:hypothetical protein
MNRNVEIYIKKNTQVYAGDASAPNSTPFNLITDAGAGFTVNQYKGHYAIMTSGDNIGATSWILSNTSTVLTLETPIAVLTNDTFAIYRSDYQRLDLFKEEKISVTTQIQNSNDIAKLYTDYSQSFNIPASKRNNDILEYWFESSLDNGFDHRRRYDAYIEIDTHRFKDGSIQLENAKVKNGQPDSFNVTFYGNLTQLKDLIKDDKLNSLDYSVTNHTYDSSNVITRIVAPTTTGDIKYPLIGNAKKYFYQDPVYPLDDITTVAGAVKWNDLFPAIKVSSIFLYISQKYGITFTGSFLSLDQYRKLYLYLKSSLSMSEQTQRLPLNFTTMTATFPEMNLASDTLTTRWDWVPPTAMGDIYNKVEIRITPVVATDIYSVFVYKDGELYKSYINKTGTTNLNADTVRRSTDANPHQYTFRLSSDVSMTFSPRVKLTRRYGVLPYGAEVASNDTAENPAQTTVQNIDIVNYLPDMKISDFITGIIKAFNLMIIPKGNNTFELNPLESFYNAGKIIDITEHVYSDDLTIEKPKLFKSIEFKYEESINVLNQAYKGLYGSAYGDLTYTNPQTTENATYEIKVPFENVLFEVPKEGKLFQTATLIDKDLKPYIPKPMLIYCNGLVSPTLAGADRIYVTNSGGGTQLITNYNRFSNEFNSLPSDPSLSHLMTMNFSNEQSSWYNELAPEGLYNRHYQNYIENLYNIKTRVIKVKALLPVSLLGSTVKNGYGEALGIALNDRLIIRNKRYIINSFTTDLTSGEASFELVTDYRGADAALSVGYRFASLGNIEVDNQPAKVDEIIYLNDYDSFDILAASSFLTYTLSSNNTKDLEVEVNVAPNGTAVDRYDAMQIDYYKKGILAKTEYLTVKQLA